MNRLLFFFLLGSLSGCIDHQTPPNPTPDRLRPKTLTLVLPNNLAKVSTLTYDSQGRIGTIGTYQTPDSTVAETELSTLQYDSQNRLIQLRREVTRYPRGSQPNAVELYQLSYTTGNQLSGISYANGFSLGYTYGATGNQPVSAGRNFSTGGLIITGGDSFTFTGSNLTRYTTAVSIAGHGGPGSPLSGPTTTFTYDSRTNPFFGNYIIPKPYPAGFINLTFGVGMVDTYFGGVDNVLNLSANNVLSAVSNSGTTMTYQYQYNTAGLPTLRTKTTTDNAGGSSPTETLKIDYETY